MKKLNENKEKENKQNYTSTCLCVGTRNKHTDFFSVGQVGHTTHTMTTKNKNNAVVSLFTGIGGLDGLKQIKIALCSKNGSTQRKSLEYPSIYRRAAH